MELKKIQKQGRDERTQKDYPTSAVYFRRCKVVFLRSLISALFLYLLRKKVSVKLDFKLGMELKKVQKQGRDERTQEDYPTSAKIHTRCRVVFLRSFISALFLYCFSSIPNLKSSFTETFFP